MLNVPVSEKTRGIPAIDFDQSPFVAIWETTRACDLACRHCRAEAISSPLPGELNADEGLEVIEQLASMGTPICVLSGGDPAKREDLFKLVRHGRGLGMRMATIPAATPRLSREFVAGLKDSGLSQMALSLDGPDSEIHDAFRGVNGAFDHTLAGSIYAAEVGLPLQINTTFSGYNLRYFDQIADLVRMLDVVFWEVFFLVPVGRGRELGQLDAEQCEMLFAKLAALAEKVKFVVKVTEAPHYRRYLIQQRSGNSRGDCFPKHLLNRNTEVVSAAPPLVSVMPVELRRNSGPGGSIGLAPRGVNSGNGHLFINYRGDICPSGFLPIACGNIRRQTIAEVYRTHSVFQQLRDSSLLKGKCGICEYRNICGGSRARAYAMTGDYLAQEPFCSYVPRGA